MPCRSWIQKSGGNISINDVSDLVNVKLFMPFTTDLKDNSLDPKTVTNTGGVALGNDGAIFGIGKQLSMPFASDGDFTVEVILKINKNNDYQNIIVFGAQGTQHLLIHPDNHLSFQSYGSGNIAFDCGNYTNYFGKETHLCVVRKSNYFYVYINGVLMGSGTGTIVNGSSIQLSGYLDASKSYYLNGTCGGFKATKKALEPYQFSLTRPMKLKYPNFIIGEREYVFKAGLWNPKYTPTLNNFTNKDGVLKNGNLLSIPYPVSGKIINFKINYISSIAWQKFHSTNTPSLVYTDYQISEFFVQSMAAEITNKGIRTISIPSKNLIGIGGYQNNYGYEVLEIWIEDENV